jgi:hypothetical protein
MWSQGRDKKKKLALEKENKKPSEYFKHGQIF